MTNLSKQARPAQATGSENLPARIGWPCESPAPLCCCSFWGLPPVCWQAIRATVAERNATSQRDIARKNELEASQAREETRKERDKVSDANQKLQRTLGDLRHTLYVSDLNRAFTFWRDGNVERVEEILDRHRPRAGQEDIRGVEWHYLRRLC